MTALALAPLRSEILLLAGEGPFLRIYSHDRLSCLASERIFDSQPIHGIISLPVASGPDGKENQTLLLLWGGRSISLLCIGHLTQRTRIPFMIKRLSSIIQTDDWILDASFRPSADTIKNVEKSPFHVFLVNSHNSIQHLRIQAISCPDRMYDLCLSHLTSGPEFMLYSAHLVWSSTGRLLVAAGTVFGEVLLWSFHSDAITFNPEYPIFTLLHYIFRGHEGSVFGVRISEEPTDYLSIPAGRCLASCSDDRTIRVWDISRVDKESALDGSGRSIEGGPSPHSNHEISSLPVSIAMGHNSRIWGLRFLRHTREGSLLLSFGEDATSQVWHLRTQPNAVDPGQAGETGHAHLQHECTFEYHAKRNIWSATAHRGADGNYTISTGGADGRIICFGVEDHGGRLHMVRSWTTEWTMNNVLDELKFDHGASSFEGFMAATPSLKILPENVFTALHGHWTLYRRLASDICPYPSGVFQGTASFEMRSPTDPAYDAEYLYLEHGEFSSEQGLKIPATRRYVYRFQRDINTISAWFVKAEDGSYVDYLFHNVNFTACQQEAFLPVNGRRRYFLQAAGQHLCVEDDYRANYLFKFDDCQCDEWELTYNVKGPKKAYSATAQYIRGDSQHSVNNSMESADVPETTLKSASRRKAVSGAGTFSTYAWADEDQLLVSTSQGYLLLGDVRFSERDQHEVAKTQIRPKGSWAILGQLTDLEASSLATSIPYPVIVLLAGRGGNMYFYQHHKILTMSKIQFPEKATYLRSHLIVRWRDETSPHKPRKIKLGIIAACLRPLGAYAFYIDMDLETSFCSVSSSVILTLLPCFIVTSSCIANTKGMLILGSRNGALAIYEPLAISNDNTTVAPSLILHGIHGKDAVTVIENLPIMCSNSDMETYILTAGKDGTYSIHLITASPRSRDTSVGFQPVHECKRSFGPNIEGACFNRTSGELWLWGFCSKDFVVWNESCKTRVLTVECGGAHRNWAFLPGHDGGAGGQLAWTKASSCRIYSQPQASHQVLQHGGHGREIKAVAISPPIYVLDGCMARFVATGAEDTAIRIFCASRTYKPHRAIQGLQGLGVFTKHTSGVQQLRWSRNGQLLFSAAACEEFFVWRVRPAPCVEIGVICEAICPPVTESADLRIMGFDVIEIENQDDDELASDPLDRYYLLSMVYSDSSVRVRVPYFPFRVPPRLTNHTRCIHTSRIPQIQPSILSPPVHTPRTASPKHSTFKSTLQSISAPPAQTATFPSGH